MSSRSSSMDHHDIYGNPVGVGDTVAFVYYRKFCKRVMSATVRRGVVVGETWHMIRIESQKLKREITEESPEKSFRISKYADTLWRIK